jgi:hypothetical protein
VNEHPMTAGHRVRDTQQRVVLGVGQHRGGHLRCRR